LNPTAQLYRIRLTYSIVCFFYSLAFSLEQDYFHYLLRIYTHSFLWCCLLGPNEKRSTVAGSFKPSQNVHKKVKQLGRTSAIDCWYYHSILHMIYMVHSDSKHRRYSQRCPTLSIHFSLVLPKFGEMKITVQTCK
jgi:hypothetical protein